MFSFARILPLFSGLAVLINAYANPLGCSGVCGNSHDPAVIRRDSDGKYFRFSTGNRISVATAPSLMGPWVAKGSAIAGGSKINKKGKDDLWVRLSFSLLLMFCGEMWRGGMWD
jgi:arabinan endo-1,5-alpha-L-arabinosidase